MNDWVRSQMYRMIAMLVLVAGLGVFSPVAAQDIGSIDFENLRSSDLSDQQLRQLWQRAQSQGYSLQDVQKIAIARGMAPQEASKLVSRVRNLRSQADGNQQVGQQQLRQIVRDSLLSERQLARRDSMQQRSRIFGSNLFDRDNISFAPSFSIPTPQSYELGAGDEIVIDIWGATDQNYNLQISSEGSISLPRVGPVYLNGLSIAEARTRLKEELSKIYAGLKPDNEGRQSTNVRISLGNIRSINITVLGEAKVPGSYTLPSLATAFNALYVAGGPDSTGTFRNIKVIRDGSVHDTLDIYNFLVDGREGDNIRLRDQDIIRIGPYESRVELVGRTKRTGIFELKNNETIADLMDFAGGFAEKAYTKRIKVTRETPTELSIKDVRYPEQKGFNLANGDSVYVGKILQRFDNRIEIEGAVYREGAYELHDTTTVYSLIQRADGLRGDAFLNRGLIYRLQDDLTTKTISFSPREVLRSSGQKDISLKKDDLVVISSIFDLRDEYTIRVDGAVQEPGMFEYVENMSIESAIFQAKGFDQSAAPYRIEVARRISDQDSSGYVPSDITKTYRFSVDGNLQLSDKGNNFTLQPYDQIFVRSSPAYFEQQNITVNGQVVFPGEYALKQQTTRISDLVEQAGGLTRFAYPEGANLTRQTEQRIDTAFINIADTLAESQQIDTNTTKVGINLDKIIGNKGSKYDLILREGDVLEIPKELQTVKISGEVLQPVSIRYEKGRSFKDYIRAAGGPTNIGKKKDAYIVYANGEVDRANRFLFFRNYPKVKPGATIFVPPKEVKPGLSPQERIGIISTIVSTLAIVSNVILRYR